jgi:hypothetical protein
MQLSAAFPISLATPEHVGIAEEDPLRNTDERNTIVINLRQQKGLIHN